MGTPSSPSPGRRPGLWLPWDQAWAAALYGEAGFFTTGPGPIAHFRTAVHAAAPELAGAILRLARRHGCTAVVDLGCGRGELLTAIAARPDASRWRLHGVDLAARPPALPARIGWSVGLETVPDDAWAGALVVAWELLDDVPCPVLEVDETGIARTVLVQTGTGRERLGDPPAADDLAWCTRWWPIRADEPGQRIEVGRPRDRWWADLVTRATAAGARAALAVDYAHSAADRPEQGSLTGFRAGRAVPPVPDGSSDVTAHVALDAVAAAGLAAGAGDARLTDQHTALRELGVGEPDDQGPGAAPGLLAALVERSRTAELLDPGSLGGFGWLFHRLGV